MSKEFLHTSSIQEALETTKAHMPVGTSEETCQITDALNRVLSKDIFSPEDLPPFPKSIVDGYAVKSSDTFGASEGTSLYLRVMGEVEIGQAGYTQRGMTERKPSGPIESGISDYTTIYIPTGGMLPDDTDAAIMIEYTREVEDDIIEITRAVSPGENVIQAGEDIKKGELVLSRGHRLRPQDIGLLAGIGMTVLDVYRRPKVAIISSGPEIYPIDKHPPKGCIRDINAYTISALIQDAGGEPVYMGICPDNLDKIKATIQMGLELADCVLVSGGSSVGSRDYTYEAISALGPPGVLVHGLSIRPGKPTIIGQSALKPIIGLPGHPASAMIVTNTLVFFILERLSGISSPPAEEVIEASRGCIRATLTRNISSPPGREDFVRVAISLGKGEGNELFATPVFGKSGLISTLIRAHGILRIPADSEGVYKGDEVEVRLF